MATVVGLDLNEGLGVIERVTKSMVRRDEDCAHLALAQARFQGDAKSLKGVRAGFENLDSRLSGFSA
jgi:hypothetical protein